MVLRTEKRLTSPAVRSISRTKRFIIVFVVAALLIHYGLLQFLAPSTVDVEQGEEEKYLAYLPHSGLSNQRIELANALLIAAMLHRTLIVPPAFLGNIVGWMRKEQLFDHLGWLTTPKDFATICQKPTPGIIQSYLRRSKCEEYHHFGAMRWTDLHDFGPLLPHIRIQFHDIVSLEHLQRQLKVSDDDTYVHTDEQLYDWRLYDNVKEANNLLKENANYIDSFAGRRYYKVYTLKQWQKHDEKLLYLGGVFGSNRLSLTDPNHVALKTLIADTLKYRRDTPLGETVRNIVDYLGGVGTFMSVHFRTGDRPFRIRLHENLLTFIKGMANLTDVALPETDAELLNVELTNAPATEMPLFDMETLPWSALCRRLKERDTLASLQSQAMMYIATDHMHPRAEDSQLRPWFKYFPCTITLGDLPDHLFTPLDKVRDLVDPEKGLRPFLIPLVDAMVAAHAKEIFTTPRSTFSRYIGELHNAWLA